MKKRYKVGGVQPHPTTNTFLTCRENFFKARKLDFLQVRIGRVNVPAVEISIVNVVATATLDRSVDLASLPQLFPRFISYDPERYFAAYFKSDKMQGKVSIFFSGKMISVGTRSKEKAKHELALVAGYLEDVGIAKLKETRKIRNIVATANLGFKPNLDSIIGLKAIYIQSLSEK